jgi:hypothetical protein
MAHKVTCENCNNTFDFTAEPEVAMGWVLCPKCGCKVNQEGEARNLAVGELRPYKNEHAARIKEPGQYDSFARKNNYFKDGIHAIFGIKKKDDKKVSEVQSIRFDKNKFTVKQAKKWLKDNGWKYIKFEPAEGTKFIEIITDLLGIN